VVRRFIPTADARVSMEAARLLAILEDDDPETLANVAAFWTENSSPTLDMHYLIVFSQLHGKRSTDQTARVAKTIMNLDCKLESRQLRIKQNWSVRLPEVVEQLVSRDPELADALLNHPDFARASQVTLVERLNAGHRRRAAELFLKAMKNDPDFTWSIPLMELLALLPGKEIHPLFRGQFHNLGLRDSILLKLALAPVEEDRERFLAGLESAQQPVVRACLTALGQLSSDSEAKHLVPLLRLLRRLRQEPKEQALRQQVVKLLEKQTGQTFTLGKEVSKQIKAVYEPVFTWFEKAHPALAAELNGSGEDAEHWDKLLKSVAWDKGDAKRGEVLFRDRACVTCHAGPTRLGPDLTGVTTRFSRDDLFTAIIYPSRDVAPAYRVTNVETTKGIVHSGIVIYESAEGVILQTGAATTIRIAAKDIASRQPSAKSLMPDGLLKDLNEADLADLYGYLKTLK
jgi:putative heme-binding domain-containing protein